MSRGAVDFEPYKMYQAIISFYMDNTTGFRPPKDYPRFKEMEKASYYAALAVGCELSEVFSKSRKDEPVHARLFIIWYCTENLFMSLGSVARYLGRTPSNFKQTYPEFERRHSRDKWKVIMKGFKHLIEQDPEL